MEYQTHSAAPKHLPFFIASPAGTDILFVIVGIFLVAATLGLIVFFFWIHSLPERMVHNRVQFDLVAVLALLSLFTHIHAFWVAALLIALIDFRRFPVSDFSSSIRRMANSLEGIAASGTKLINVEPIQKGEGANMMPKNVGGTVKGNTAGTTHA